VWCRWFNPGRRCRCRFRPLCLVIAWLLVHRSDRVERFWSIQSLIIQPGLVTKGVGGTLIQGKGTRLHREPVDRGPKGHGRIVRMHVQGLYSKRFHPGLRSARSLWDIPWSN
jgi:hypothetical protein